MGRKSERSERNSNLSNFSVIFISVIFVMILLRNFTYSRYGRGCIAIRENELAAETMGIDTTKAKIKSFVFSAFIAGLGGGLYAHLMMFINPEMFNQIKSTDMLMYLYAGGVGSYSSALLGALIFTFLPEFLRFTGGMASGYFCPGLNPDYAEPAEKVFLESTNSDLCVLGSRRVFIRKQITAGSFREFSRI